MPSLRDMLGGRGGASGGSAGGQGGGEPPVDARETAVRRLREAMRKADGLADAPGAEATPAGDDAQTPAAGSAAAPAAGPAAGPLLDAEALAVARALTKADERETAAPARQASVEAPAVATLSVEAPVVEARAVVRDDRARIAAALRDAFRAERAGGEAAPAQAPLNPVLARRPPSGSSEVMSPDAGAPEAAPAETAPPLPAAAPAATPDGVSAECEGTAAPSPQQEAPRRDGSATLFAGGLAGGGLIARVRAEAQPETQTGVSAPEQPDRPAAGCAPAGPAPAEPAPAASRPAMSVPNVKAAAPSPVSSAAAVRPARVEPSLLARRIPADARWPEPETPPRRRAGLAAGLPRLGLARRRGEPDLPEAPAPAAAAVAAPVETPAAIPGETPLRHSPSVGRSAVSAQERSRPAPSGAELRAALSRPAAEPAARPASRPASAPSLAASPERPAGLRGAAMRLRGGASPAAGPVAGPAVAPKPAAPRKPAPQTASQAASRAGGERFSILSRLARRRLPKPSAAALAAAAPRRRRDPSPSRLRYRMERLARRPMVRFAMRNLAAPAVLAALVWTGWNDPRLHDWAVARYADARLWVENRPEFALAGVEIAGGDEALREAAREELALDGPGAVSTLTLDLDALRRKVEGLPGVASARLRIGPDQALLVDLTARRPAALWRWGGQLQLVDAEGVPIGPVFARADRPDLPLIVGEGADRAVPEALALAAAAGPIRDRLRALVRVGERRWTVALDRDQSILLPEDGAESALRAVVALQAAPEVTLLDRDVLAVDMRLADRPTLRLSDHAVMELTQMLKGEDA